MQKTPVYLYTEAFFLKPRIKSVIKKIIGRNMRGPQAVFQSLVNGLQGIDQPFFVNRVPKEENYTICALSNVRTLAWALKQKSLGKCSRILAGPNIVVTPNDFGGIIKDSRIDMFLVPSQWPKDFFAHQAPEMGSRIAIWAAGVRTAKSAERKDWDFIIYNKIANNPLVKNIIDHLSQRNLKYLVITYGSFSQKKYFEALQKTKYLVYLSESESQGLSMFEAWAHDVPTLNWERGFWKYTNYCWEDQAATPYVNREVGMRFKDFTEFKTQLPRFLSTTFSPKNFIENNFAEAICARKYLALLDEVNGKRDRRS